MKSSRKVWILCFEVHMFTTGKDHLCTVVADCGSTPYFPDYLSAMRCADKLGVRDVAISRKIHKARLTSPVPWTVDLKFDSALNEIRKFS